MVYYCVEMIVGKKHGFIAKLSNEFLNTWNQAAFFEDFDKADECAENAYFTAKRLYPKTKDIAFRILATKVTPARADIIK